MLREALKVALWTSGAVGVYYVYRREKYTRALLINQECIDEKFNFQEDPSAENSKALRKCINSIYERGLTRHDVKEPQPFKLSTSPPQ
mmetsp:Transcript_22743/g.40908  ORF Transcript_22743/g.40908 Transcript_22743/m.40908 type:complete len:88 (+) Transcript_22743:106-369(+)